MQASIALNNEILRENYPFSKLVDQEVNTLIFPNLAAGNIAYNILKEVGSRRCDRSDFAGYEKTCHVLQLGSSVRSIYNMALVAVIDAQIKCRANTGRSHAQVALVEKNKKINSYFHRRNLTMNIFTELGRYILMIKGMFSKPENMKMYWKEFMHQCVGNRHRSLGIVVIISVFMGAVSALQTAYQLVSPLIPLSTIAQIVRDTVILEFSPTLVCIVLAGVVGSKIAGELGNMRVSEQIDALEIMGINTKTYLILPKILAALLTIPMLVIISAVLGILGGRLAAVATGIVSASQFDKGLVSIFQTL